MTRWLILLIALGGLSATYADDAPVKGFEIITQRNIFDPNRTTSQAARTTGPVTISRPVATGPRLETLTLTGAVIMGGEATAVFAGTSAATTGLKSVGDTIADYQITAITTAGVMLTREGTTLQLAVGSSLARALDGTWQPALVAAPAPAPLSTPAPAADTSVAPGPTTAATAPAPAGTPTTPAATPTAPAGGATPAPASTNPDDILKRLRERRQRELQP